MQRVIGCVRKFHLGWLLAGVGMAFSGGTAALGDEGMWLFNNPPKKILKEKYGFEPDQAWFEHLQRERPLQLRRLGVVRVVQRAGAHQPSCRGRRAAKAQQQGEELSG